MPIVFHFKDRGDPDDCQLLPRLEGEKRGRLASPLILRPHQCSDGTFEALALVLAHPAPTDVVFVSQGHKTNKYPVRPTVTIDEAKKLKPLNATKGTTAPFTDPLQRYLHLLQHGT
jgi:CRISPR-associated protein Cmr1